MAGRVDPDVGVAGIAVHVPPGARDAPVAHQPGHLVRRVRRRRPEVPLHVVEPAMSPIRVSSKGEIIATVTTRGPGRWPDRQLSERPRRPWTGRWIGVDW